MRDVEYYLRWYHEKPLQIMSARRAELSRVHALLYRCIVLMAEHWHEFIPGVITLSDKAIEILDYQSKFPFQAGAFRPDWIVTEQGEIRLIEITSRFFGHGLWSTYNSEMAAQRFMEHFPNERRECLYGQMWDYLAARVPEGKRICVLKSADKTAEIERYKAFYEARGHQVTIYEAEEVEAARDDWHKAFLFSALNQTDLLSYEMDTLRAMVDAGIVNDLRTILLIHDKRFFALLFDDAFTSRCLSPEETEFLRAHTMKTHLCASDGDALEAARANRENWILKPCNLGKSVGLHAGCMTPEDEWQRLLDDAAGKDMILQPMARQRIFPTVWEGTPYDDYICGMMLCMDSEYYGSGLIRCSSAPVTNKTDDRKMAVIESDSETLMPYTNLL